MSVSIEVDVKDLVKEFDRLEKDLQKDIKDELNITAREIETGYKQFTPLITARLKSSIHTETADFRRFVYSNNKGESFDGSFREKAKNDLEVLIGTNVEYAGVIERGFSGVVNVSSFNRTVRGVDQTVKAHTRRMNRQGNNALSNAFDLYTKGLDDRIKKLIK